MVKSATFKGKQYRNNGALAFDYSKPILGEQKTLSYRTGGRSREANLTGKEILSTLDPTLRSSRDDYSCDYDNGHPFSTSLNSVVLSHPEVVLRGSNGISYYRGSLSSYKVSSTPVWPVPPTIDLNWYGTKAIQNTLPTTPTADVSVALAELIGEGIPHAIFDYQKVLNRKDLSKKIGGDYLNLQFGWLPLIKDIESILEVVRNSFKIVEQFERDSGRNVRRRYSFPTIKERTAPQDLGVTYGNQFQGLLTDSSFYTGLDDSARTFIHTTLERDIWFSGAYTYLLESGEDPISKLKHYEQLANKLLGLRLTPEVLWELAPWSWLADWKMNIGAVLSNSAAFSADGLVIRYGYLMCKTTYETVYTTQLRGSFRSPVSGAIQTTLRTVQKERVKATPFGFGLNPNSFTNRQWSILGALGMTKAPGLLRN